MTERATHTDYKNPGCLRIEGCPPQRIFILGKGWHDSTVRCVSPGSGLYAKHFRKGLPSWPGSPEQLAEEAALNPPEPIVTITEEE